MKLTPWLVVLSLSLGACSGSKSAQKVNEEPPQIELSDADEFIENPAEAPASAEPAAAENPIEASLTDAEEPAAVESTPAEQPVIADEESPVVIEEDVAPQVSPTSTGTTSTKRRSDLAGTSQTYKVGKNETLMMIAFKIYGDYGKWKDLAAANADVLKGGSAVWAGMTLKYTAPRDEFVWSPQGNPWLIRTGDTLGKISKQVYTTPKKWKLIWNNNKPLIKDPNLIFAGFTIYYLENGREVASEI